MGTEVVTVPSTASPVSPCCAQRDAGARVQLWAETAQPQAEVTRLSVVGSRIVPPRKARVGAGQDLGLHGVVDEAAVEAARAKREAVTEAA
jgi:hypothetical protein